MFDSKINKFSVITFLPVFVLFILFSGCWLDEEKDEEGKIPEVRHCGCSEYIHLHVGFPFPVSGTLHCDVYKQNDFSGDPDWSNDVDNTNDAELTSFSGIRNISIHIPYSEVIDDKVYFRVFLDQNSNGIPDGSELCEYYGPPYAGMYFEYYNNKNVSDSQGNKCNTVPVNSSIDIILGNVVGG